MAETVITPTALALDVMSADTLDADGTVATTPSDGWDIEGAGESGDRLLLKFLVNGSGDTITVEAGARPPAQRTGLGDLALVLAASDVRYIVVEASRFLRTDGSILVTCTDAGSSCIAWLLPKTG